MSETETAGGKPIPPTANNIRAVAHSALVEALPEWMKLSDRVRVSDAVAAAVEPLIRASERERLGVLPARERDLVHHDLGMLLEALGLGNFARPDSPHDVMMMCVAEADRLKRLEAGP